MGILVTNGDSFTYGDELPGTRRGFNDDGSFVEDTHHHLTFTHKLAQKLDIKYVNLGANGSSNQKIFRRTMDFLQRTTKEIDYMVITWSSWGRLEVCSPMYHYSDKQAYIQRECNMNQIIPNHYSGQLRFSVPYGTKNDKLERQAIGAANKWFEHVYTPQTAILHSLNYMRTVQFMCDAMGIKLIQGIIHNKLWLDVLSSLRNATITHPLMEGYVDYLEESFSYLRPECQWGFFDNRKDIISIAEDNEDCEIQPLGHVCEKTHTKYAENLHNTFIEMNDAFN